MVLAANLGLVDTGAGMAMMSFTTLVTYLMKQLKPRGLKFKVLEKKFKELGGVGGKAKVLFYTQIPMGLGGIPGTMQAAVTA